MKILVSHPTGNANVRATIQAFSDHHILKEFQTTIATNPDSALVKMLPASIRTELLRRKYGIPQELIRTNPLLEYGRLGFNKLGFRNLTKHEVGKFSVDAVYHGIDKSVAKRIDSLKGRAEIDAVYAYEDGALISFEHAKKNGVKRIYDLPKGYWKAERDLLGKERELRPEWSVTLAGFKDSDEKLERKDEELRRAEHIIVASSFTKHTLSYFEGELPGITVVPYGFPPVNESRVWSNNPNEKLKLLFVGSLSQLKGLANVLEAVELLKDKVELTIVGRKSTDECEPLNEGLKAHRYMQSLPHHEVLNQMSQHDVFLFPSLFEGFGLVVTEAMSQGTPVITTRRTCGGDIISHDEDGWIIEAGSTTGLTNQLKRILDNRELVEKVGRAAREKARKRPWSKYGEELVQAVRSV